MASAQAGRAANCFCHGIGVFLPRTRLQSRVGRNAGSQGRHQSQYLMLAPSPYVLSAGSYGARPSVMSRRTKGACWCPSRSRARKGKSGYVRVALVADMLSAIARVTAEGRLARRCSSARSSGRSLPFSG